MNGTRMPPDGPPPPQTVRFAAGAYTATEGGAAAPVTVTLSPSHVAATDVALTATYLGGATAADVRGVPATVTFGPGETTRTFSVTAADDGDDDDGESLRIGFDTAALPANVSVGSPSETTVTLVDNDHPAVEVRFAQAAYTVGEGDTVVVTVQLDGAPGRQVAVPITRTHRGGASAADYAGVPPSVVFGATDVVQTIALRAVDDGDDDDAESVVLGFERLPDRVSAGTPSTAEVEIVDNDGGVLVTASFEASSYTAAEGGASAVVAVTLDQAPGRPVTLPITQRLLGGASRADYTMPQRVTLDEDQTRVTFEVAAVDDADDDDGESVELGFGDLPAKVRARGRTTARVALTDDDLGPAGERPGDLRIDGGFSHGDLEVYYRGDWGLVCAVRFDDVDAGVACRQLGFDDGEAGRRSTTAGRLFLLGALDCTGRESRLADCPGSGLGNVGYCSHLNVARVACSEETPGDAALAALTLSGIPLPEFESDRTFYRVTTDRSVSATTVEATPARAGAAVRISDPDGATDGARRTVALGYGVTRVEVEVASAGGAHRRVYRVEVTRSRGEALTGEFVDVPATHPGRRSDIKFELRFSRQVATNIGQIQWESIRLSGAQMWDLEFAEAGSSKRFLVSLVATGTGDVTAWLEPHRDCNTDGVCMWDGRRLSNRVAATVRGPASAPAVADAVVSGTRLGLRFKDPLDAGSAPDPDDFVVLAEGPPAVALPVVAAAAAGDAVLLVLGVPAPAGAPVTLHYLAAPMHPLRLADGRTVGPLDAVAVRPVAPDAVPRVVAAPQPPLAALLAAVRDGGADRLDLSGRDLGDLGALDGLGAVAELNLAGNRIEDLSWLRGRQGLRVLDLSGNRIEDAWPLAGLHGLVRLDLSDNRIADVGALEGLAGLEVLRLGGNRIADVVPLAHLGALAHLSLADNAVADAGLLADLGGLVRLDLSGNRLADVSALGDLSRLVWVRLAGNPVADLGALGRLTRLRWVWVPAGAPLRPEPAAAPAPLWIDVPATRHAP